MVLLSSKMRIHKTIPSAFTKIGETTVFVYLEEWKSEEINIYNNFNAEENFFMQKIIRDILKKLTTITFKITVILTGSDYALPALTASLLQSLYDYNIPMHNYLQLGGNINSLFVYKDQEILIKHVVNKEEDILRMNLNEFIEKNINKTVFFNL